MAGDSGAQLWTVSFPGPGRRLPEAASCWVDRGLEQWLEDATCLQWEIHGGARTGVNGD